MAIIRNMVKCLNCSDTIESVNTHDFKFCKCQAIFVDGGKEYLRRGGDLDKIYELSIIADKA